MTDDRLVALLREQGWEPESNVCASCGHAGGDHDLGNWCLTCPRLPAPPTFSGRIAAGWDFFGSFTKTALWNHAAARLIASGVRVGDEGLREAAVALRERLDIDPGNVKSWAEWDALDVALAPKEAKDE